MQTSWGHQTHRILFLESKNLVGIINATVNCAENHIFVSGENMQHGIIEMYMKLTTRKFPSPEYLITLPSWLREPPACLPACFSASLPLCLPSHLFGSLPV